jgi:hypothetical protein
MIFCSKYTHHDQVNKSWCKTRVSLSTEKSKKHYLCCSCKDKHLEEKIMAYDFKDYVMVFERTPNALPIIDAFNLRNTKINLYLLFVLHT